MAPGRDALSYTQLLVFLKLIRSRMAECGVGHAERVAVALPGGPELAVCLLATTSVAACAPLNPDYTTSEFARYLDRLRPSTLILQAGTARAALAPALERNVRILELTPRLADRAGTFDLSNLSNLSTVPRNATPLRFASTSEIALVLQTSGTTAHPKVVPLTHTNLLVAARNIVGVLNLNESDVCLSVLPLFHIHGFSALLATLISGGCLVCPPRFAAPQFYGCLEQFHPTWYTAAPSIHQAILAHAPDNRALLDQHSLRFIRSASSPLPPQVIVDMERTFHVPVIEAYGMTEAAPQISSNPLPPGVAKRGSVGRAAGPEIVILNVAGSPVPPGVKGEVAVRGANIIAGYEGDPETNAQAFAHGWLRTGDEGYLDAEGYLFITGRLREMINRGGEKIAPREVDEALLAHTAVAEAAAFAVPHPTLGDEVTAAVVLRPGARIAEDQLRTFVAERLAYFKVPHRIVFVTELPKGPSAKVLRSELAVRYAQLTGDTSDDLSASAESTEPGPPFVEPTTELEKGLAAIWSGVLKVDRVGTLDDFFALGGDSMLATLVISRVADLSGYEVTLNEFFESPTIASLAVLLTSEFASHSEEPARQSHPSARVTE
jgi:acyl-CoA synthetase (AMP-forming)/AMP-acid ligase II